MHALLCRALPIALISLLALVACVPNEPMILKSPDQSLQVFVQIDHNNSLIYSISKNGKQVLRESHLGVELAGQDFTSGVTLGEISRVKKLSAKAAALGTSVAFSRGAREKVFTLINRDNARLQVRLRVGDKGVAVQYASASGALLLRDSTSVNFAPDAQLWLADASTPVALIDTEFTRDLPLRLSTRDFSFALQEVPVAKAWPSARVSTQGLQAELEFAAVTDAAAAAAVSNWRLLEIQPAASID